MIKLIIFMKYTLVSLFTLAAGASIGLTTYMYSQDADQKVSFSSAILKTDNLIHMPELELIPLPVIPVKTEETDTGDDDDYDDSGCS